MAKNTKPLGTVQKDVLECLRRRGGYWYGGCGWLWDTHSNTTKVMESLLKRGIVTKVEMPKLHPSSAPHYRYDLVEGKAE